WSGRLALVAYSTPKDAYAELIPAFQKTTAGKGITFSQSYGASGAQARAVVAGLPTDVAALSLAPDVTNLVDTGVGATDWYADASAATSLQTFTGGVGDVLISYENEAIAAKAKGKDVEWIVPDRTILIENPIAVTTRSTNATAAKAFVDFLRTKPAQEIFAKY